CHVLCDRLAGLVSFSPLVRHTMLAQREPLVTPLRRGADGLLSSEETVVSPAAAQECLVADARAALTPAEMVERKLISLLKNNALAVSQVQMRAPGWNRGR